MNTCYFHCVFYIQLCDCLEPVKNFSAVFTPEKVTLKIEKVSKSVKKCQKVPESVKKCRKKVSESVKKCENVLKNMFKTPCHHPVIILLNKGETG